MVTSAYRRKVIFETCKAIYDTIAEAGEEGIPSGHLYAMLTGIMSLDVYNNLIDTLKRTGMITEKFHVLTVVKKEVK